MTCDQANFPSVTGPGWNHSLNQLHYPCPKAIHCLKITIIYITFPAQAHTSGVTTFFSAVCITLFWGRGELRFVHQHFLLYGTCIWFRATASYFLTATTGALGSLSVKLPDEQHVARELSDCVKHLTARTNKMNDIPENSSRLPWLEMSGIKQAGQAGKCTPLPLSSQAALQVLC